MQFLLKCPKVYGEGSGELFLYIYNVLRLRSIHTNVSTILDSNMLCFDITQHITCCVMDIIHTMEQYTHVLSAVRGIISQRATTHCCLP